MTEMFLLILIAYIIAQDVLNFYKVSNKANRKILAPFFAKGLFSPPSRKIILKIEIDI